MGKHLKEGMVFQIPLWGNFGYAYAKYIIFENTRQKYEAIKIYCTHTKTKNVNLNDLDLSSYIYQPILLAGSRVIMRKKIWEVIGKVDVTEEEHIIPDFKYIDSWDKSFFLTKNLLNRTPIEFEKVKHLEDEAYIASGNIEIRTTITFIEKEGKKVEDYLDLTNENVAYRYKIKDTIYTLDDIPKQYWGKAKD
ncbi:hypothetical protein Fleli_0191 [Bernardetia litoralis DSM 6794]|uniref:Uncharacterized protein n=1 Tax=Bernardetia litoralis (strain ATCC 23117 / DSM 6794 / NBRC 15988 / NCIMB 1366 / Fx l1 / Sio-4) TaxID=880071 RepID=I4AFF4_BERLS|nr:immunity 26/phosphotriesterase HocA family protein [Bernardetia litoralis]AFM02689.1 hypothetical protein Fleli_0191 [Bernardetia litoralis DSM 6794]